MSVRSTVVSLISGHEDEVSELLKKHLSEEWIYGQTPAYDAQLETRLSWGLARLCFKVKEGRITDFSLFTDSLDTEVADRIKPLLLNRPFGKESMVSALDEGDENARELARALEEMTNHILDKFDSYMGTITEVRDRDVNFEKRSTELLMQMQQESKQLGKLMDELTEKIQGIRDTESDSLKDLRENTAALSENVKAISKTLEALSREE